LAAPQKPYNHSDLRNQQRGEKIFYRLDVRLGVCWHISLGFEPIATVCAGPKIEHSPLTDEFRPFRSNQLLAAFGTGRLKFTVTERRYRCHGDTFLALLLKFLVRMQDIKKLFRDNDGAIATCGTLWKTSVSQHNNGGDISYLAASR